MHRSSTRRLHSIPLRLLSASLLFTQALFIQTLFIQAGAAQSAMVESALSTQEREMVSWVADQEDDMVTLLERLTNINTGTLNKAGVAEVIGLLNTELTLAGDVIEMPSCPGSEYTIDVADHLLATKSGEGKRMLMIGHVDTVFPVDSPFQTFSRDGDTAYGPGVSDMKGGLVVMLYALKALNHFGELEDKAISILLNSDEEIGSLSSRKYVEQQAALHDFGLVYESSGNNRLTRARKGLG
ncbi:M20/M25/M40 family metallo-hydrolase, partial [Gammaproteobacteria bacterium]|nr:M20/M25/M40 family metallo-hydrolase [Gammaproteobacteria bacterium]